MHTRLPPNLDLSKMSSSKATMLPTHPYHPTDLELANYLANEWDTLTLVAMFGAGCTAILSVTYLVTMSVRPRVSTGDLWTIKWFVLCRCTIIIQLVE
jgi:cholestenol Delta-isomerase